jgi:hypothetical protein
LRSREIPRRRHPAASSGRRPVWDDSATCGSVRATAGFPRGLPLACSPVPPEQAGFGDFCLSRQIFPRLMRLNAYCSIAMYIAPTHRQSACHAGVRRGNPAAKSASIAPLSPDWPRGPAEAS